MAYNIIKLILLLLLVIFISIPILKRNKKFKNELKNDKAIRLSAVYKNEEVYYQYNGIEFKEPLTNFERGIAIWDKKDLKENYENKNIYIFISTENPKNFKIDTDWLKQNKN